MDAEAARAERSRRYRRRGGAKDRHRRDGCERRGRRRHAQSQQPRLARFVLRGGRRRHVPVVLVSRGCWRCTARRGRGRNARAAAVHEHGPDAPPGRQVDLSGAGRHPAADGHVRVGKSGLRPAALLTPARLLRHDDRDRRRRRRTRAGAGDARAIARAALGVFDDSRTHDVRARREHVSAFPHE